MTRYKTYRSMEQAVKAAAKSSGRDVNKAIQAFYQNRVAEKVCATMQDYNGRPSSRVKDLVDLAISMVNEEVDANKLSRFIAIECRLRRIEGIARFSVPDNWKSTLSGKYTKPAKEATLPSKFLCVEDTEAAVSEWLSPVFSGDAAGKTWNPKEQRWA